MRLQPAALLEIDFSRANTIHSGNRDRGFADGAGILVDEIGIARELGDKGPEWCYVYLMLFPTIAIDEYNERLCFENPSSISEGCQGHRFFSRSLTSLIEQKNVLTRASLLDACSQS